MARNTKPLSGGAKDKFLRGIVASVEGVPPGVVKALTQELTNNITEVRVRRQAYERVRDGEPAAQPGEMTRAAALPQIAPKAPESAAFDPFAFSVVAVLTKKGKAVLAAELDKVGTSDDLRRLAEAQHLALDPALADMAEMRAAILVGAERRIAERKAAAS